MSRSIRYALAVSLVSLFTACGSGGGGDSVAPPVATIDTYQLQTAWVNFFNDSSTLNFTVSGMISGVNISGSGAVTQSVPASATFENVAGLKKTEVTTGTVTGTLNGVVVTQPINGSVTLYVDTNYLPLGETGEDFYSVVTGPVTIPPNRQDWRCGAVVQTDGLFFKCQNRTPRHCRSLLCRQAGHHGGLRAFGSD